MEMNRKNRSKRFPGLKMLYVVVLLAFCCLPLLLVPLAGESDSAEKRTLAAFPSLIKDGALNTAFSSELDDWITDHFAFRSQLITANNALKAAAFATSDEDKVIVGTDDWLYFAETAADYLGQNRLEDADLERLAVSLDLIDEYVSGRGGTFVFAVAPNKSTIVPEHMPAYYRRTAEPTNLDRLSDRLADKRYFADLRGALRTAEGQTYHARDSHWNNLGARVGYNTILDTAGKAHETYADAAWEWERNWAGDLDAMIFPTLGYQDRQAVFAVDWTYRYTSNFHSEEDVLITTRNDGADGSLLMFRDSFTNALLPFLAQNFGSAKFSRAVPYSLGELETAAYDTVVIEIVERNLRNLLQSAPVMPAPGRTLTTEPKEAEGAVLRTRDTGGYRHFYGAVGEPADAEHLYLRLSNGTEVRYVEAFPLYEASLLKDSGAEGAGFSAYIPLEDCEGYEVTVVL